MSVFEVVIVRNKPFTVVAECCFAGRNNRQNVVRILKSYEETAVGHFYVVTRNGFIQNIDCKEGTTDIRKARKEFSEVCESAPIE